MAYPIVWKENGIRGVKASQRIHAHFHVFPASCPQDKVAVKFMSRCKSAVISAIISATLAAGALPASAVDSPALGLARQLGDAFVSVADKVSPAVVIINVVEKARPSRRGGRVARPEEGEGSGIIVTADGYILTNNHVVDNADKITVVMKDGQEFDGEVKGTDPATDIAVVKINPKKAKLTVARLGDSDRLRVGEFVVAIGHPYELTYSVTVGHVSAVERELPRDPYDVINSDPLDEPDYIQTDAVINPGNSGGPLINLDGEVIGVNAMIEADTYGSGFRSVTVSRGIGLAIPINHAKAIMNGLISDGKFTRSRIGIAMSASTKEAMALLNLETVPEAGVVVSHVLTNSPAERGGLKSKDIILAVDGTPVNSGRELHDQVSFKKPGQSIAVSVLRDNKPRTIKITTEAKPETLDAANLSPAPEVAVAEYGFTVRTLSKELIAHLGLSVTNGVVVTGTQDLPASLAAQQQIILDLRTGDVITKLNEKTVTTAEDFAAKLKAIPGGISWTMRVVPKGTTEEHFKAYHAPTPQ